MKRFSLHHPLLVALLWLLATLCAFAQQTLPLSPAAWTFGPGASHRFEEHLAQKSLYLKGEAFFEGLEFEEGRLEVDIAPTDVRSFAALLFWAQPGVDTPGESYEEVYLRMHKSAQPDAIQYSPVYQGESTWQLYYPLQAAAPIHTDRWNHLRLEIKGDSLWVFLNEDPEPLLTVGRLRTGFGRGKIGLRSLGGNHFANLRVQARPHAAGYVPGPPAALPAGVIPFWYVSAARPAPARPLYPSLAGEQWQRAAAEEGGLLPLNRWVRKQVAGNFEANSEEVVYARLTIYSETAQLKGFLFDFSDKAHVFLNGQLLYSGSNGFRFKGPLFRGDMHPEANQLYLPLQKGENELLVAVIEKANGWALMGRFSDMKGIRLAEDRTSSRR
ncbi:LamG domain-containing protein [Cesiribacter andamanensis]|uniref:3-keto-disaccharide hydrolase domain-containing protein n=1 Tax=Cesiribacter andamanensis AMV16 TaxID=1279009 RepID=M7NVZ3_9BACT|nr:hypothetical protein [Cesiribacter andamanensis]EMR02639.1 hypothetical protein ADICEAN_02238 [Cesiribacter andamanensis AMV16]